MATYYSSASNGYRLRLDLTPGAQDINNNTTVVAWELLLENSSANSMNHYSTYSLTIDGTVRASASGIEHSVDIDAYKTVSLRSGSITVTHQPDGTRTLPFSAKFRVNEIKYYTPQTELTLSGNLSLTTIPRATTPTASTMTMGVSSRINLMRASSDFVHDASYKFGAATGTIATGAGTYVNWAPPLTLATQVPSATHGTLTLTVTTKRGATVIGTKTLDVRLTVPDSVVPDVTYVEMTNYDPAIQTAFAGLVRHQSRAVVKVIANGVRGSTITKVDIKVGGKTYPAQRDGDWWVATTDVLTMAAGTHARGVEVTITDTRGRRATRYEPLVILNWFKPEVSEFTGYRVSEYNSPPDDAGTEAQIYWTERLASVGQKNKFNSKLEYLDPVTKQWVVFNEYTDTVILGDDQQYNSYHIWDHDLSPDYTYQIRYTLSDYFETVTQYFTLPTSHNVLDFKANKRGLAIGKASELDALEVNWNAYFLKEVVVKGVNVLDRINDFRYSKTIPNNTSFGALHSGLWFASSGNNYPGMPAGEMWGHLLSWGTSANMVVQIFFGQSKAYWRHWISADQRWYGWKEIGDQTQLGSVVNGTDLHTLEKGVYRLGGDGQFVNGTGSAMYGVLEVVVRDNWKFLRFHSVHNGYWVKAYDATTWSAWKELTGT